MSNLVFKYLIQAIMRDLIPKDEAAKRVCHNCRAGIPRELDTGKTGHFTHYSKDGLNVWCDASGLFGKPL